MTRSLVFSVLALAASSVGCFNRAHMTENYGRAYRQAFERQIANPGAGQNAKTPHGLDALEAGIVVETYRAQLAPKGTAAPTDQSMILVSPQQNLPMGYVPPPSVPPSR